MIKLFKITDLKHTVFAQESFQAYLFDCQIVFTNNIAEADILMAHKMKENIFGAIYKTLQDNNIPLKPILLWTHEPRFSPTKESKFVDTNGFTIHNMNLYTGDVYFSNYSIYGHLLKGHVKALNTIEFSKIPVVGLSTYIEQENKEFILNGKNIDLTERRQRLLVKGRELGIVDIYGKSWPSGLSISESRGAGWRQIKEGILRNYQFNICLENTGYPYYCTEKIWDSIKWGCLPIYSSFNNNIYEIFAEKSFIDTVDFTDDNELYNYIRSMSPQEYLDCMNSCISTFNHISSHINFKSERKPTLDAIIKKIMEIYSQDVIK
ncbi:MAG: glycosyltransferase family 10 [Mucilaginibacter sp.]|uniref:glycosyltransferase family 10 domain-containing protein n=1 Tax=Mucilaginibacter sp. TaxID=1882438 RepID=UPI003266C0D6